MFLVSEIMALFHEILALCELLIKTLLNELVEALYIMVILILGLIGGENGMDRKDDIMHEKTKASVHKFQEKKSRDYKADNGVIQNETRTPSKPDHEKKPFDLIAKREHAQKTIDQGLAMVEKGIRDLKTKPR